MSLFLQVLWNGVLISPILTALGISVVYSTTRIFHLAHGVVVVGSAYAFWWAFTELNWHLVFAIAFALAVAATSAHLMNELVYEKLRKRGAKGLGYLIATLALLLLGTGVILALFGAAPKTFRIQPETFAAYGITFTSFQLIELGVVIAATALYVWLAKCTRLGKAMRATADNEQVAEVLGVDTRKIRRIVFLLSAVLAAAAGVLWVMEFSVDPNAAIMIAVRGFTATVIGGVGSVPGAVLGSLIIGVGEQGVIWFLGSGWRNAVTFIILFLFLLLRPSGIFGSKRDA